MVGSDFEDYILIRGVKLPFPAERAKFEFHRLLTPVGAQTLRGATESLWKFLRVLSEVELQWRQSNSRDDRDGPKRHHLLLHQKVFTVE